MGRNGAGKSTLLRHAAGLLAADARADRARRTRGAAAAEPRRLLHPRARRRGGLAAGARGGRAGARWRRATRATSPAASASAWRWRSSTATATTPGGARAGRADARHGPRRPRPSSPSELRTTRRGRPGGDRRHARPRVRRGVRRSRGAARRRARDRRRADGASCSPAAGTSRPRRRASSAAPAARCCPSRAPSCCGASAPVQAVAL